MQIYVSKDGEQFGPYPVEQLLEYVQQGIFTINDLACHDGQNWVKIAQVPGFAEAAQPAAMQAPSDPEQEQAVHEPKSIIFNILVGLGVITTAVGILGVFPGAGTVVILGFALSAAGIFCSANHEKQWGALGMMLLLVGAITAAAGILDLTDHEVMGFLIVTILFLVASVLAKSGVLAVLAALSIFPTMFTMLAMVPGVERDLEEGPVAPVTIILFAALSLGAYHWSKVFPSDYKRLAIIFSRTSLLVVNLGFWLGSLHGFKPLVFVIAWVVALVGTGVWAAKNNKRWVVNLSTVFGIIHVNTQLFSHGILDWDDSLVFVIAWAVALMGTSVWAAKNDKRWVVNLSAALGIITIFTQFDASPLSILIAGLTSLGIAFAIARYNKHAPIPSDPKTARIPAKSCESMPARAKTAEVPGFADAGDSVTTPQQDQVVQEHAVEQQPANANASPPPANINKIILWTSIGGVATLLVVGLLIWLLGGGKDSEPESNQPSAEPLDAKIAQVGKIDLDDPPLGVDAPKVVHSSKIKWQNRHAYFKGGPFTGMVVVKYENGQKRRESTYKDGELMTIVDWKPGGEKLPEPKLVIITRTGNGEDANSDGPSPHAHIIGLDGSRSFLGWLDNIDFDDCEKGSTDIFSLPFDYPVSEIQGVELMAKSDDAWRVETISFQFFDDEKKSKPYAFEVNQWFSAAKEKKSLGAIKSKIFSFRPDSEANHSPAAYPDEKPAQVGKIDAQEKEAEAKASPLSNPSPVEPSDAKPAQVGKVDLNDPKTRNKIVANAVKFTQLQSIGNKGEELFYRKNQPKPYTGWSKWMGGNGRIRNLVQRKDGKLNGLVVWFYKKNGQKEKECTYKDGQKLGLQTFWYENGQKKGEVTFRNDKKDGLQTWWYENGQKKEEVTYGDGKLITAVGWKPIGEKCPDTNVVDGNGFWVYYNEDGTVERRVTYREGERVD